MCNLENVSRDEIWEVLDKVKIAVNENKYVLSMRPKNMKIFDEYIFDEKDLKQILLNLGIKNFCDAKNSDHEKFSDKKVYIFGYDKILIPTFGTAEEMVSIYIKLQPIDNGRVFIISFHEQESPLIYKYC